MSAEFELAAPGRKQDFRSIAGPHSAKARTDTWLTPRAILEPLGQFDLDPCAAPSPRPWPTAARHIELPEDGLKADWHGRVWLNPPYGKATGHWLKRLAEHRNGIALIFARTDTQMFFDHVWEQATAILFLRGRLTFCDQRGAIASFNAGGPSCLVAYNDANATALQRSGLDGHLVDMRDSA